MPNEIKIPAGKDHIGLYPRKVRPGEVAEGFRPMVYVLTTAEGSGQRVIDLDHPLAAPFRRSAINGEPSHPWQYICVRSVPDAVPVVLGALAATARGGICFFPATEARFSTAERLGPFRGRRFDHFTLDPLTNGVWRSHSTFRDGSVRNRHGMPNSAYNRPGEMLPWLSMFLPSLANYQTLPRQLRIPLDRQSSDVIRYSQEAIGTSYRPSIVGGALSQPIGESFWQVDFFVGQDTIARPDQLGAVFYQEAQEFVSYGPRAQRQAAVVMITTLNENQPLAVVVTRPNGHLPECTFVTPPEDWFD